MDVRATFEIVNKLGMHARAATKLVQTASRYRSEVQIEKDGHVAILINGAKIPVSKTGYGRLKQVLGL